MKMTRKLIPALVMLLVSAVMLSTASFAWFASNSEVAASNMHVKVKSTTKYLQISATSGSGFSSGVTLTNDIADRGEIELVHANLQEGADDAVTLNWQLGDSDSSSTVGSINQTLTITDEQTQLAPYALLNTVYVRMSEDSNLGLNNIRIKPDSVTVATADSTELVDDIAPALRLLIVYREDDEIVGAQIWSNSDNSITSYGAGECLIPTVNVATEYALSVYLFYDGEDSSAITDNDNNLQELVVGFSLIGG